MNFSGPRGFVAFEVMRSCFWYQVQFWIF